MHYQSDINSKEDYLKQFLTGFSILNIEFILTPRSKINFGIDEMKGDRWRGALGRALKKQACEKSINDNCIHCGLNKGCFFFQCFEADITHPYVIRPELDSKKVYEVDDEIRLSLILIGETIQHTYNVYRFVNAIEYIGRGGIGQGRGKFNIKDLVAKPSFDFTEILNSKVNHAEGLIIELLTPLKIKETGKGIHYSNLSFETFFKLLLKRIINLNNIYCGGLELDRKTIKMESNQLQLLAKSIKTESYTGWKDYQRFSSRQNISMKIGGLIGLIKLSGDLSPFYPYLKIGEVIGVGQNTTSGFGRYKIMPM
ncbi:MAG: CRISPR system precrRNA processing endoribonuclease RAMP protein Cas6 [Nitrospirae bacterium]|nr:CRISPR system precrRNA processing endoribonuclease RAMP protein Cas6 [Nitrospirota bacterium]